MPHSASVYHRDLLDLESKLERQLHELSHAQALNLPWQHEQLSTAQVALSRLQILYHELRMEIAPLSVTEQSTYTEHAAAHGRTLAGLQARLRAVERWAWHSQSRGVSNAQPGVSSFVTPSDRGETALSQRRIASAQESALASLASTERGLYETEEVACASATLLRGQTEQIQHTNEGLDGMGAELHQASQELRAFMRRMLRDRVFLCLSILVLLCLIATVVVSIVKYKLRTKGTSNRV